MMLKVDTTPHICTRINTQYACAQSHYSDVYMIMMVPIKVIKVINEGGCQTPPPTVHYTCLPLTPAYYLR